MKNKVTIDLPAAFQVEDYHEIPVVLDMLKGMTGDTSLKTNEVKSAPERENPHGQTFYWGILYKGRYPSKATINACLEKAGCDMNPDYDD